MDEDNINSGELKLTMLLTAKFNEGDSLYSNPVAIPEVKPNVVHFSLYTHVSELLPCPKSAIVELRTGIRKDPTLKDTKWFQ
jgi:hypothetical protein